MCDRIVDIARNVAPGITAGMATTVIMHPFDLIKVRLQVSSSVPEAGGHVISNLIRDVLYQGTSQVKISRFYRGLTPNLIGNGVSWGLYFNLYQDFVQLYSASTGLQYMGCAMLAGTSTSLLTNPIWVLKTRMLSSNRETGFKSIREGVREIWAHDGVRGFWRGFVPGLAGIVQASIQFSLYERMKDYYSAHVHTDKLDLSSVEFLSLSAASKLVATLTLYPYQVVRARLQVTDRSVYRSALDVIRHIYTYEGATGFYKGLVPNVARVVPATCITFVVYENMRYALR
ncbi:mitochondrial FAD carrier protein Flx1p [Trichomonascus vanleenenianus]|uniref:mitochondrial FAD carrier protein Flx1p n=1 Tax=Trichomonascus vanleenenianus TaxID=2268995 RepID=UPI003ECA0871